MTDKPLTLQEILDQVQRNLKQHIESRDALNLEIKKSQAIIKAIEKQTKKDK